MAPNYKEYSFRRLVLIAAAGSVALHLLLFALLSEFELDLFSIVQQKELAVTIVEPHSPPAKPLAQITVPAKPQERELIAADKPIAAEKRAESMQRSVSASAGHGAGSGSAETGGGGALSGPGRDAGREILPVRRELLKYDLYWSGVFVGKAELEAFRGEGSVTFLSKARSAGIISAFYTVDDFAQSILLHGQPVFFRFKQHEGKKRGTKETRFDYETKKISFVHETRNIRSEHDLTSAGIWDILSAFYHVRIQPLEVGKKVGVDVFDSGAFARIGVDVLRKESITVPDIGTFDTIVIRPLVETEGLFSKKGDIYIWLSDDDQRIPLRVETVVPIGAVTAELRSRIVEK